MIEGAPSLITEQRGPTLRPTLLRVAVCLTVVAVLLGAGLAIGHGLLPATRPNLHYVDMTEIDWLDQNHNVIASTRGVNISQGQFFSAAVTIACTPGSQACNGTEYVSLLGTMGFGNWPAGVAPCGLFQVAFNVTGSDLPLTIQPNGSGVVIVNLQAPDVSYPVQTPNFHYVSFDYTGHLDVYLDLSPR